jgi:hypothetical protein
MRISRKATACVQTPNGSAEVPVWAKVEAKQDRFVTEGSRLESGGHILGGDVGVAFGLISHERNETIPDDSDLRPHDARQHSARFVQQQRKC